MHGGPEARATVRPLTSLRGVAALFVVLFHGHSVFVPEVTAYSPVFARGYLWVDLFFILSGYVLAMTHGDEFGTLTPAGIAAFLRKRFARVVPLHWAVLGVLAAGHGALALGVADWLPWAARIYPASADWGEFLRTALLVHAWGFETHHAWNLPSWSISAEWALYLLFPILMRALGRASSSARWALLALSGGGVVALGTWRGTLDLVFDGSALLRAAPEFVLGVTLERLARGAAGARAASFLGSPGALALVVAAALGALHAGAPDWAPVLLFALLVVGARSATGAAERLLSAAPIHGLGLASYSLYLVHLPLLWVVKARWPAAGRALDTRLLLLAGWGVACVAVAALSYRLLEVPARRWLRPRAQPAAGAGR